MTNALKNLVSEEKKYAQVARESANQIWMAGLGAVVTAKDGGVKLFEELVVAGKEVEDKGRKIAESKALEVSNKATQTWSKVEGVLQDRVSRALLSLGVPSKSSMADLSKRIDDLNKSIGELVKKSAKAA